MTIEAQLIAAIDAQNALTQVVSEKIDSINAEMNIWRATNFTALLHQNGSQKIAGGLIIQWGTLVTGADGTAIGEFPEPFPNAVFVFNPSMYATDRANYTLGGSAISNAQFSIFASQAETGAAQGSVLAHWVAIGH